MPTLRTARRAAALLLALASASAPRPAAAQAPAPTTAAAASAHPADAMFMRMMIPHHAQALEMSALARTRTTRHGLRMLAERIAVSQHDEIAWMQRWLRENGEAQPRVTASIPLTADAIAPVAAAGVAADAARTAASPAADPSCLPEHAAMGHCTPRTAAPAADAMAPMDHAAMGHGEMGMDHALMPGMLTPAQMTDLAASTGDAFDRRFLVYMTGHHEGALTMVHDLFATPGAAQTTFVYRFATDIDADQRNDIRRMAALLATLPPDPTFRPGTPSGAAPTPPPAPHHR